ncbi:uncharacterized protein LOC109810163 [Cajanus cajan]|uniref:Uncharacterized protein n=1 Tax=Cajanus cajan TaxID=3821 RepID=A0A151SFN2_CAJCA|nr:uncharacterized protein LOC109810163 [Cajanus cajan]KYP53642.1 hypothetical protein KK1_024537 [Cajanus cajan]
MAITFKYLITILFLTVVIRGSSYCSLNNINIGTTRSGRIIDGKPEWNVVLINNCSCVQSHIRLACKGFRSVENVNSSILSIQGDSCLLINGYPLKGFDTVRFSYAWDPPFLLMPTSSRIYRC